MPLPRVRVWQTDNGVVARVRDHARAAAPVGVRGAWREGIDVFVIQSLLGHASPETTRRYVAVPRTAERAAIDRLAA